MLFPAKKIVQAITALGYGKDLNLGLNRWLAGMTGQTGSTNDLWFTYLRGLGYTGSLNSMVKAYYAASKGAAITNPIPTLFRNNEKGVHFDPSDFTTLFQDNAGTTPVTAVGQTVGLMLDKSKGLVLGPELVTNGTFDSGIDNWLAANAGHTLSWDGTNKAMVLTNTSVGYARAAFQVPVSVVAGRTYKATFRVVSGNAGANLSFGQNSDGSGAAGSTAVIGVGGTFDGVFTATVTDASAYVAVVLQSPTVGFSCTVDNISIKELPGYHATQATSTARPIVGRHPITGRQNLLTYTEDFSNAAWVASGGGVFTSVKTPLFAAAPDGTMTACRVQLTCGSTISDQASLTQAIAGYLTGTTYANGFWIKSNTGSNQILQFTSSGRTAGANVTATSEWTYVERSVASGVTGSSSAGLRIRGTLTDTAADILVWHPTHAIGTTAIPYQKVTSTYDVTEAGVNDAYYLKFDGVDDFMVTPSIDFSGTDKMSVFAGVRKLSDAVAGVFVELSANWTTNVGSFDLYNEATPSTNFVSASRGDAVVNANHTSTATPYVAPITSVISSTHNIVGDLTTFRINQVTATNATGDKGLGNFGNYPLYIGMRGGTSLPFNGHLYSLVVRGALSDASQIRASETYVNSKTGAY